MTLASDMRTRVRRRFANKYSWGAMVFLWLLLAVNDNARYWITGVLQPAVVQEFQVDAATIGWFAGGLGVAQGLFAIPLGLWSDRGGHGWARKHRYGLIVVGYSVFTLLTGFTAISSTFLVLFVLQAFNKAFSGVGESAEVTSITEWWSVEKRGFATGLHHTAVPWGTFLGGLVVAGVFTVFGSDHWRLALFVPVIIVVPALIGWWRFSSKERYDRFEVAVEADGETPPLAKMDETVDPPPQGALRRALRNPNLVFTAIITGLALAIYTGISFWLPLYLAFVADYSLAKTAAFSFVFTLTGGIGQIFWGGISDRIGRKPALLISFVWIAVGVVLLQFVGVSLLVLVLVQLFLGCATNGVYPVLYSLSSDSSERGATNLAIGMNMTGQILGGLGPIVVGLLVSAGGGFSSPTGFIWALWVMAGIMILAAVLLLLFTRETVGSFKRHDFSLVSRESAIQNPVMRQKDLAVAAPGDAAV